jgi:hypothetical protein
MSPFLHLLSPSGVEGVFGFKYMSSFLYALGWPLTVISLGLILQAASKHITAEIKSSFLLISSITVGLGIFYLMYTLIPMTDFSPWIYYLLLATSTMAAGYSLHLFAKGVMIVEEKLKANISRLILFIVYSEKYIETKDNRSRHFNDYIKEFEEIS